MDFKNYTGWKKWTPTTEELANFYTDKESCPIELLENEYLMMFDSQDNSLINIYKKQNNKIIDISHAAIKIRDDKDARKTKIVNARNPEQKCAMDMLHDPSTTIKLITGPWGSGKSMLLVTAALEALKEKRFEKIVWIRNNVDVKDTKDLGALPGDANEKLLPFLGPFIDHVGGKKRALKMIEDGILEVEPLQFLRGRDIQNAIIMCSEAENLTREQIQLIIARAAEGSAIFIDSDVRQRDKESFERSRGIETLIEKLTDNPLFGYVKLVKTERSATAALADKLD